MALLIDCRDDLLSVVVGGGQILGENLNPFSGGRRGGLLAYEESRGLADDKTLANKKAAAGALGAFAAFIVSSGLRPAADRFRHILLL